MVMNLTHLMVPHKSTSSPTSDSSLTVSPDKELAFEIHKTYDLRKSEYDARKSAPSCLPL